MDGTASGCVNEMSSETVRTDMGSANQVMEFKAGVVLVAFTNVPEPSSLILVSSCLMTTLIIRKRRMI